MKVPGRKVPKRPKDSEAHFDCLSVMLAQAK